MDDAGWDDLDRGQYFRPDGTEITGGTHRQRMMEWERLSEAHYRVAETMVIEGVRVSTVYLGLNHNFMPDGPPLIFETMTFVTLDEPRRSDLFGWRFEWTEDEAGEVRRYSTRAQAIRGHNEIVADLLAAVGAEAPLIHMEDEA